MRAILKKGKQLVFSASVYKDNLYINLYNTKWTYKSSTFNKGRLLVELIGHSGIELAFSGYVEDIKFISQEKDQLVFKIDY